MSGYAGWAIVEVMGHRTIIGEASEVEQFGTVMLRIDVPTDDGQVTQFYGGSSIFSLTPVTEATARDRLEQQRRWTHAPSRLELDEGDEFEDEWVS